MHSQSARSGGNCQAQVVLKVRKLCYEFYSRPHSIRICFRPADSFELCCEDSFWYEIWSEKILNNWFPQNFVHKTYAYLTHRNSMPILRNPRQEKWRLPEERTGDDGVEAVFVGVAADVRRRFSEILEIALQPNTICK